MKRLNITLPLEIANQLKSVPNKSKFISEALGEKLAREKRAKLEVLLAEGYKKSSREDQKVNFDWGKISFEKWE